MLSLDTRKLVPSLPGSITAKQLSGNDHSTLWSLLDLDIESTSTVTDPDAPRVAVGVSLRLCKKGMVEAIALATEKFVALLAIESNTAKLGPGPSDGDNNDLSGVLNHPRLVLLGVGMTRILLLLHHQLKIRANGVDLPALFKRSTERAAPSPGDIVLAELDKGARKYDINALWYGSQSNDDLCLRAWLSAW